MKDVGIVGLPQSGKTTLFVALTRTGSAGRANQAVVDVPDDRLEVLAKLERSRKIVPAKVRFVDVPGGLTAQGLAEFREMDALCLVARAFGEGAEPERDLDTLRTELLLADLKNLESGMEKARKRARVSPEARQGVETLERAVEVLEREVPLRDTGFEASEITFLRGYGLLSLKPWVPVANTPEGESLNRGEWISVSASLEAEVAGMEPAAALELLHGFGIAEPGLNQVIARSYSALNLITFLTTGEDETRAWAVRSGARAPEAAGVIHSDMQRGFIRAEVVTFDDLVDAGSWDGARAKGRLRVEGKDYEVKEGDVMHIRFAL